MGIEVECEAKQGMTERGRNYVHEQVCRDFIYKRQEVYALTANGY